MKALTLVQILKRYRNGDTKLFVLKQIESSDFQYDNFGVISQFLL